MRIRKWSMLLMAFLCLWLVPSPVSAEQKEIEATGIYNVGNGQEERPSLAKQRAYQDALRRAVDAAGVLVASYSRVEDEITAIAGEVLNVTSTHYQVEVVGDAVLRYTCNLHAVVDTEQILRELKKRKARLENEQVKNQQLKNDKNRRNT